MGEQEGSSDRAAFDRLYHEHGLPVRNLLRLWVGNLTAADDLTQETFLHLWRTPGAFDPARAGVKAYLLGIAKKKAADWWRRKKEHAPIVDGPASSASDDLTIRDAINHLPQDPRAVLWLREVEGTPTRS